MCVEQDFRCDCMPDCDDGSDESVDWGGCSVDLHTYCGRNIADGKCICFEYFSCLWHEETVKYHIFEITLEIQIPPKPVLRGFFSLADYIDV